MLLTHPFEPRAWTHRAASELEAERSVASAKVERYRQRAEQEGAAAQEELELARQGCRRDQEALHAAHAAAQQVRVVLRILGITRYTARTTLTLHCSAMLGPSHIPGMCYTILLLRYLQATRAQFDEELAQLAAHAVAAQEARRRDAELERAAYEERLQERRKAP